MMALKVQFFYGQSLNSECKTHLPEYENFPPSSLSVKLVDGGGGGSLEGTHSVKQVLCRHFTETEDCGGGCLV